MFFNRLGLTITDLIFILTVIKTITNGYKMDLKH